MLGTTNIKRDILSPPSKCTFTAFTREKLLRLPSFYYIRVGPGTAVCLDRMFYDKRIVTNKEKTSDDNYLGDSSLRDLRNMKCGRDICERGWGERCDFFHVAADFTVLLGICLPLVR